MAQNLRPRKQSKTHPWNLVYQIRQMWFLGLVYFMYGFSYVIYMTFFAAYLTREVGLTQAQAGVVWAMVGGLSIFCGVIWGGISDLLGRRYGSALAYLTLAASFSIFDLFKTPSGYTLSAVLFGLTAWSIPTIMAAAAGDYVGPRLAPAGLGFVTLFFGIGQALGPAIGGYLADFTGSFFLSFLLASTIALVGMAFFSIFRNHPRRTERRICLAKCWRRARHDREP